MSKEIVVPYVPFIKRVVGIFKTYNGIVYLYLIVASFNVTGFFLLLISPWVPWLSVILLIVFYVAPGLHRSYKYIYHIYIEGEYLCICYCTFDRRRIMKIKNVHLKLYEGGLVLGIPASFAVAYHDGREFKFLISQFKIEGWKNQEYVEHLKLILSKD